MSYSNNMNLGSIHAEQTPGMKTEMTALNYMEFQVLQQVLGAMTSPHFLNTILPEIKVFPTHSCNIMAIKKT